MPGYEVHRDAIIVAMIRRVVAAVRARRILVFGSRARGDHRPGSDLDLLVEVADGTDIQACSRQIRTVLADRTIGLDCIVVTSSDLLRCQAFPQHIVTIALSEGVWVHGSAA